MALRLVPGGGSGFWMPRRRRRPQFSRKRKRPTLALSGVCREHVCLVSNLRRLIAPACGEQTPDLGRSKEARPAPGGRAGLWGGGARSLGHQCVEKYCVLSEIGSLEIKDAGERGP